MKDIYDVLLNFKKIAYEFYEWNNDDDIIHVKKMPIIKVDENTLNEFINYDLCTEDNFLSNIKDKTEIFTKNGIKKIEYACILFDNYTALAIKLDQNGLVIERSKLLFEEADDLILSGMNLEKTNIKYNTIRKIEYNNLLTRKEYKVASKLNMYLKKAYENKKYDELKYIYLECFNYKEEEIDKIYNKLISSIKNANYNIINKLSNLLKVLKK